MLLVVFLLALSVGLWLKMRAARGAGAALVHVAAGHGAAVWAFDVRSMRATLEPHAPGRAQEHYASRRTAAGAWAVRPADDAPDDVRTKVLFSSWQPRQRAGTAAPAGAALGTSRLEPTGDGWWSCDEATSATLEAQYARYVNG
jgi:hypothetical protein